MNDKYKALIDKNVCDVVLPPPDANIVGSHWTYVCNTNQDGATRLKYQVVLKASHKHLESIMGRHMHQLLNLHPYGLYVPLQHITIGPHIKWTSTMCRVHICCILTL